MFWFRNALTLCILPFLLCTYAPPAYAQQSIEAAFSPSPDAVMLIERTINHARQSVEVAAYSFTSEKVAIALVNAHRRGVKVRVLLDKGQRRRHYHAIEEMQDAGIPIRFNSHYGIMHDKFLVIDNKTIETGSFNFTASAEKRNAENVLVIEDYPPLAKEYLKNWNRLWDEGK